MDFFSSPDPDRYQGTFFQDRTPRTSTLPSSMLNSSIPPTRVHLSSSQVRHKHSSPGISNGKWQYNSDNVSHDTSSSTNRIQPNLRMYGHNMNDRSSTSADFPARKNQQTHPMKQDSGDTSPEGESSVDVVRDRLMSIWNNVKYGWNARLQSSFSDSWPIYILGTKYSPSDRQHRPGFKVSELELQKSREKTLESLREDCYSRIWFTYRRQFPKLHRSLLTTDCGWGCMLRTGSMMMAQAFSSHFLTRDWRWQGEKSDKKDMIHRMIIKWFLDVPEAPFSIHQLVKVGYAVGKRPGDWYGPATVAHVMTQALAEAFLDNPVLENIAAYVAQDCTVYIQDIVKLCTEPSCSRRQTSQIKKDAREKASSLASAAGPAGHRVEVDLARITREADAISLSADDDNVFDTIAAKEYTGDRLPKSRSSLLNNKAISTFNLYTDTTITSTATSGYASIGSQVHHNNASSTFSSNNEGRSDPNASRWRGIVIFIPLRLGGEKFNPVYAECVKSLLKHPLTIGIIGGRPKHSLYFIGVQEDKLIYLDPHLCQDAVNDKADFPLNSFHCRYAGKMPITKMDPSCTVAFYCRTRDDFNSLVDSAKNYMVPGHRHTDYPIFVFSEGSSYSSGKCDQDSRGFATNDSFIATSRLMPQYSAYTGSELHLDMCDDFVIIQ